MARFKNENAGPPSIRYLTVNVFDPGVSPVKVTERAPLNAAPGAASVQMKAFASEAATVVAPDTAMDAYAELPLLAALKTTADIQTITEVPVVSVTLGPTVARST